MHSGMACEALQKGVCLDLRYHGFTRTVEVHAVGISTADHPVMRCWQLRGGSKSHEPVGWKLLRLDEIAGVALTTEKSLAPRKGYKHGDRDMKRISCPL